MRTLKTGGEMGKVLRRTKPLRPVGLYFALIALGVVPCVPACAADPDIPQHLTDLVVQALPMGRMADVEEAKDPAWPLKAKASRVSREQLHCLREQLSSAGYRAQKLHDVEAYVLSHPADAEDDIKVLDNGAAFVANAFFMGSLKAKMKGTTPNRQEELKSVSARQMIAYTSYEYDPKYAALRDLVGIGNVNDPTVAEDARTQAIKVKMITLNMDLMYRGMDACKIAPTVLL